MPLGAPAIIGPISTCSGIVRVQGQFEGARVRILIDGDPVPLADTLVGWAQADIPIDRTRLVAGRKLVATQQVGSQTSQPSPAGVVVETAINGLVTIPHRIFACGRSLYVVNCCPGARIDVRQGANLLGVVEAIGDTAWVAFAATKQIGGGSPVEVAQTICTSPTPVITTSAMPSQPPTTGQPRRLGRPTIVAPLEECQRLVPLANIAEGAVVALSRRGSVVFDASVPVPQVNILVDSLARDEEISAVQSMPRCEVEASQAARETVKPLTALARPRIDGPVCAGAHQVVISRLKPGATLIVLSGGTEIGRWQAAAQSMPVDINVPTPAKLTARQELCGIVSPASRPYTVASARSGRWFIVEDDNGKDLQARAFAIHIALARTDNIVLFSGDQHSQAQHDATPQDIDHCELFDCSSLSLEKIDAPTTDVFCSGHAFLPDGRLVVAGGTEKWLQGQGAFHDEHFPGLPDSWIFDPIPNAQGKHWRKTESMRRGRWYPTLLTLPSGRVLALSGHPRESDTSHNNHSMETLSASSLTWQHIGDSADIDSAQSRWLYPRVFVGPTGGVFSATPIKRDPNTPAQIPAASATWPGTGTIWKRSALPPGSSQWGPLYDGFVAPGVLLPLLEAERASDSYRYRVLLAGDVEPWIADLGTSAAPEANPRWISMGPRTRRINSNLVLLPSGEVLLTGGVDNGGDDNTAVKAPEMAVFDGTNWKWQPGAPVVASFAEAAIARNYHSTALLMPDGRVFTAGGNINSQQGDASKRRLQIEIYEPWYVCRPRPRIISVPPSVKVGHRLIVDLRGPGPVTRLVLIRAGSATHGFNPDQRVVSMIARETAPGQFAGVVPEAKVAIPGIWLVFAVTDKNVPSRGRFVRIDP